MARRTPEQELENQMNKMADMGITITTRPAPGADHVSPVIQKITDAAKAAGIYEEDEVSRG